LRWHLFSLELNASPPGTPITDAAIRYGESLAALALARRERGDDGIETLYLALGTLLHDQGLEISPELLRKAAADAGMADLPDRTTAAPDLPAEVEGETVLAKERSIFGVPTIQWEDDEPIYGPILSLAPLGSDALRWWEATRTLTEEPTFFELKRWPRAHRPGEGPLTRP
jgi:hypothetical protein